MNVPLWGCCFRAFAFSGFRVRFCCCSSIPLKDEGPCPSPPHQFTALPYQLSAVLIQLIEPNQNVTGLASIWRTKDA
jgi:hypothetical protein